MRNRMMRWFDYGHLPESLQMANRLCMCYGLGIEIMDDTT